MLTALRRFTKDESGATAVEYGLIAALVALACTIAMRALGIRISEIYPIITAAISN